MKQMLVVVVVVLGLGGCGDDEPNDTTTTTAPPTTRAQAGVGATIPFDASGGQRVDVTLVKVVDPAPPGEYGPPQGRFVAVQLRFTNNGQVDYEDTPTDGATLIDAEGRQYTTGLTDSSVGTGFGDGLDLEPDGSFLGFLTFDVPSGAVLAKFRLPLDSRPAEWSLR